MPPVCPVPGGVFIMGSDKTKDPQTYDSETSEHPVEADSFSLGQHPVTVAEYACFVRATQHAKPKSTHNNPTW